MKKLFILTILFLGFFPKIEKNKLYLTIFNCVYAQAYGEEDGNSGYNPWEDDFFAQYGGRSAGDDFFIEMYAQDGYIYIGGDTASGFSYIDADLLVGQTPGSFSDPLFTDDAGDTRSPSETAVYKWASSQGEFTPTGLMLPEVLVTDLRSGNYPWWWGDATLFLNGGIKQDDYWKLYTSEDPGGFTWGDYSPNNSILNDPNLYGGTVYGPNFYWLVANYGLEYTIINFAPRITSDFEKSLFHHFWTGDIKGTTYNLNSTQFDDLKAIVASQITDYRNLHPLTDNVGNVFYINGFNTYYNTNYDFAIGSAYAIYNSNGQIVGIYDRYNFDPGNRNSWFAEFATRGINFVAPPESGDFYIRAGDYPDEIFESVKLITP